MYVCQKASGKEKRNKSARKTTVFNKKGALRKSKSTLTPIDIAEPGHPT